MTIYDSSEPNCFEIARHYSSGGLNVIPLRTDGSKCPAIRWKQYTKISFPWYQASKFFIGRPRAIGIICG